MLKETAKRPCVKCDNIHRFKDAYSLRVRGTSKNIKCKIKTRIQIPVIGCNKIIIHGSIYLEGKNNSLLRALVNHWTCQRLYLICIFSLLYYFVPIESLKTIIK